MKQIFFLTSAILFFGCTKPVIEGRVVDYYNSPIKEVNVSVEGTQFEILTNDEGEYSISYVPGKVKVIFRKSGYTENSKSFDIATESVYPAENVQLIQIPNEKVCTFGTYKYIPINLGKVITDKTNFRSWVYSSGMRVTFTASGNFISLDQISNPKFIINSPNPVKLVKLLNNDVIFITEYDERYPNRLPYKNYEIVKEKIETFGTNLSLRTTALKIGKYAYVEFVNSMEKPFKDDNPFGVNFYTTVYLFEIK